MTDQHPIFPPHELINQWYSERPFKNMVLIDRAAQWGADQELEACCSEIGFITSRATADVLRSLRRPKPPSLKEQALEALQFVDEKLDLPLHNHCNAIHTIRTALEALPND
jgi:hypothetical protein